MSGLVINHNLGSMNALAALNQNQNALQTMLQQLSTGKQINSAADNAAGYAISQKMQSQINGLDQASQNSQDGISLLQTASGALNETQSILQRMRQLAVQSSNDTNTSQDRQNLQAEVSQLTSEVNNIASTTQFNTKNLLDGSAGFSATVDASTGLTAISGGQAATGSFSVSAVDAAKIADVTFSGSGTTPAGALQASDLTAGSFTLNGQTVNVTTATAQGVADAVNAVTSKTGVTASVNSSGELELKSSQVGSGTQITITNAATVFTGASDKYTNVTSGGTATAVTNAATTFSGTDASATGTNLGGGTITGTGNTLTVVGGTFSGMQFAVNPQISNGSGNIDVTSNSSLTFQIGANTGQSMSVAINSMTASSLGISGLDISTQTGASNAIGTLDTALQMVSSEQANLGAYQNRLQSTINNVDTASQNLTTAQSGITDTNMASAMANFTKDNVLQQAAISMLAQANQQPQLVLKLLG